MSRVQAADEAIVRGQEVGPLHGLPIAHKDLVPTKDLRTTWGSRIYKGFIPDQDGLIVERLKKAGAICIGKTNTPEFGAGSQTFNEVFGETLFLASAKASGFVTGVSIPVDGGYLTHNI
jgi:amidase